MLSQRPILRQEQRLRMTPQLYQAIRIMALPLQELQASIQQELERNPALEVLEDNSTTSLDTDSPDGSSEEDLFANTSDPGYTRGSRGGDEDSKRKFLEGALARPETLQEHLLWQLRLHPLSAEEFALGELLIHNLDDNGFIREDPALLDPAATAERLHAMMELIQGLDPPGTCTRDYIESLAAQIRVHPHPEPGSVELVRQHMALAERGKLAEIARKMEVDEPRVRDILAFVRQLDPIPGRNFVGDGVRYVSPDIIVKLLDGEITLLVNDEQIPVLGVSDFYDELSRTTADRELKKFVNSNLQDARWFIRSIEERNRSLVKVARAVVEFQRDFFRRGAKYLVPLTLKDVAEEVGVHEATVSRLANGKYVQTEFGIFELRYFFTNSISGAGSKGSRFSKTAVKEMIREIVAAHEADAVAAQAAAAGPDGSSPANGAEEAAAAAATPPAAASRRPLSDSRIAEILAEKGVRIARRTVAKYRNELDIDSSYRRA